MCSCMCMCPVLVTNSTLCHVPKWRCELSPAQEEPLDRYKTYSISQSIKWKHILENPLIEEKQLLLFYIALFRDGVCNGGDGVGAREGSMGHSLNQQKTWKTTKCGKGKSTESLPQRLTSSRKDPPPKGSVSTPVKATAMRQMLTYTILPGRVFIQPTTFQHRPWHAPGQSPSQTHFALKIYI